MPPMSNRVKLNISNQTISNTTKKICTFHLQIIEPNSEIIARAENIFLKFQHAQFPTCYVCISGSRFISIN